MSIEVARGLSFKTPEEELAYLRAEVSRREREISERGESVPPETIVHEVVREHAARPVEGSAGESAPSAETIVLNLSPDNNDATIEELAHVVKERGVRAALAAVEKLKNEHVLDDFHRFLVQYLREGYRAPGVEREKVLRRALDMTLFSVVLPEPDEKERERPLEDLLSAMEQFVVGMGALGAEDSGKRFYSLEIATKGGSGAISFYAAVPNDKIPLFENQMRSVFPRARLEPMPDDYNVFIEDDSVAASYLVLERHPALSLRTYDELEYDPLNALLNAFASLPADSAAALQVVMEPPKSRFTSHYQKIERELKKGTPLGEALSVPATFVGEVFSEMKKMLFSRGSEASKEPRVPDEGAAERVAAKVATPIFPANVRFVVSAPTPERATAILADCEASFTQFAHPKGNRAAFVRVKGRALKGFVRSFAFRYPESGTAASLSARELSSLVHFPVQETAALPEIEQSRFEEAPAPPRLPKEGTLLGTNHYRGKETPIRLTPEDRLRHLYVIGQTGTGKSSLLKNIILQDIAAGHGVCMIDPHGNDIVDVLAHLPPERADDVIYFDPADRERVFGLNMLEYDTRYPEQKTFVVNELLGIFRKLYGGVPESMGPAFEQYFRNATLLVMEDPATGNTMLDIGKVLADAPFRRMKLARCKNPVVRQFWEEIATKAGGEASLENIVPYITNKFDDFTANEIMRPIIGQERSSFNFRDIMDTRKILLVNLSKGRLGERNSNLLGLIIVGKFLMAALSRADAAGKDLPPFYLHIDEFQNVTTDSIAQILSEARKYKLGLTIAHQFIAQIGENVMQAIFGNVGSLAAFRVGAEDAKSLTAQFAPVFSERHLMNIDNFNCHVRLLARGVPQTPFTMRIERPTAGRPEVVDAVRRISALQYGRPKEDVEREIRERFFTKAGAV